MDAECEGGYEPLARWGHVSVALGGKVYMWGGRTEDFSEAQQRKLASSVEVFDCHSETWMPHTTRGTPPRGLYNSAYALQGSILYVYGGWDGQKAHNSLFQLNLATFEWAEVKVENPDKTPTEMSGCGLVACGNRKLVLFGGYGVVKERKKKEVKKKKAEVDERYALVTVEEVNEEVEVPNEQKESKPVENGTEEQTVRDNGTEGKNVEDPVGGGEGASENGLVASVMAEIEEREGAGKEKDEEGGSQVGGTGEVEERRSEGETKEGEPVQENGDGGEEDHTSNDGAVQKVDVVNEHVVGEKCQTAVVIKLPVSFDLASESEATTGGEVPKSVAGESETTAAPDPQPGDEQSPAEEGEEVKEKEEEVKEKEDSEECNTTFSIYRRNETDPKGWTNEVKIFDLDTRMWSSQPTSGSLPPPCVDFSFISPDKKRAVVFGGYQPPNGITFDTFLLDMETWVWTKLSGQSEVVSSPSRRNPSFLSHPSARDGHAACVIEGAPHPLLLVTGGWDATDQAVCDLWMLHLNSGLWKQITGGKEMGCRFWHTTVVSQSSSRMRQLLVFGGCPGAPESHTTGSWPKMADTVLLEMGKIPSLQGQFAGDSSAEERWMIVDSVTRESLGHPVRRLRETVLLTSFRAQRAESLLRSMLKKITAVGVATPQRKVKSSVPTPTPEKVEEKKEEEKKEEEKKEEEKKEEEKKEEEKKEEEKVKKPFWQKPTEELQMTYEEIGRGRFSVVKVAIFHETRVAARCLFTRIPSKEHRLVFTECLELAAQLRHPNLVSFMGAILDREPVIITELMGCNLRSLLEKTALTYYQLLDVAEGVSKALQYLHAVKPQPVVHGELTGTSVLLEGDRGPCLKAKLSDYMTAKYFHHLMTSVTPAGSVEDLFAHSREHPSHEYKPRIVRRSSSRSPSGSPFDAERPTRPLASQFRKTSTVSGGPPDSAAFSTKRDVYLFGILLVEMATRTAVLEVSLQYLIESIAWSQVAALAKRCLTSDPSARPDMTVVVSQVVQLAASKP